MTHIRLRALELENFRSWREPARIEFPERGLVLIRGPGSGCGKTSVVQAIADALGVCAVPATRLASWGSKGRRVAIELTSDQGAMRVERTSGMRLVADGKEVKGAPKFLTERLQGFLGLRDMEWLRPLTFRPQRSRSFFLQLTDADKKAFLASILQGLEAVEKAVEASETSIKLKRVALTGAQSQVTRARAHLEALSADYHGEDPTLDERLEAAEEALAEARRVYHGLREAAPTPSPLQAPEPSHENVEALRLIDERIAEVTAKQSRGRLVVEGMQRELADLQRRLRTVQEAKAVADRQRAAKAAAVAHLETVVAGLQCDAPVCTTCERPWGSHEALDDFQRRLEVARGELASILDVGDLDGLQGEVQRTQTLLEDTRAKLGRVDERLRTHQATRQTLLQTMQQERQRALWDAQAAERERRALWDADVARATLAVKEAEICLQALRGRQRLEKEVAAAQKAVDQALLDLQRAEGEVAVEEAFVELMGPKGFIGRVFDGLLAEVSRATNELLARLNNVSHVSVTFTALTETAQGKARQAIVPVFRSRGYEVPPRTWDQEFSGGQVQAIELAVDLAVSRVLGQRTGASPAWLVLDEPFVGLGAGEIEQALEVLKVIAQERLVIIIDHAAWVQDAFDQVLDIAYQDGYSRLAGA